MRMYQMYVCECCGKESKNCEVIEACEATRFGLTVEEKHSWDALKSSAKYFKSIVLNENNEITLAAYRNALEKLITFEHSHNL